MLSTANGKSLTLNYGKKLGLGIQDATKHTLSHLLGKADNREMDSWELRNTLEGLISHTINAAELLSLSHCAASFIPPVGCKTRVAGRLGRRSHERSR